MKLESSVFAASAVRKERILLILRSWKYKTVYNCFTGISLEKDSSKNTPRFRKDSENAISQSWEIIELVLTCFSFDFDAMLMSSVSSSFILSLFPFIHSFVIVHLKFISFHPDTCFFCARCHVPKQARKLKVQLNHVAANHQQKKR